MDKAPEIEERQVMCEGRFLTLGKLFYRDQRGVRRTWEAVDRRGTGSRGAVFILARIEPDDEILLVRQFRPPAGRLMLEFPAGLIDPGEDPETAARRELLEETGYQGRIMRSHRPGYSSPGMTGESIAMVEMIVDGDYYRSRAPEPCPEENECIEVLRVKLAGLDAAIAAEEAAGVGIDSKIYTLSAALRLSSQA